MRLFPVIDRITQLYRRIGRRLGVVIVIVVVVAIMTLVSWLVTSRGGGDGENGEGAGGAAEWMQPLPEEFGPDGEPIPQATLVARAVAATIEAMPTPTPLPTPDVAATLQAELALNRERVRPVLMLNPLDLETDRDPYLTPDELRYFRELGPRLWTYTRVWLHLQEVLSVDIAEWDFSTLQHDLGSAQSLLESAPERPDLRNRSGGEPVDPLVRAYADSIETGMTSVRQAVARLSDAEDILAGPVGHPERDELLRITRDVEELLAGFDDAMSVYGCSVCGELFRRVEE